MLCATISYSVTPFYFGQQSGQSCTALPELSTSEPACTRYIFLAITAYFIAPTDGLVGVEVEKEDGRFLSNPKYFTY